MNATPPGPDWWQASDGQWYPPSLRSDEPIDWERVEAERAERRRQIDARHHRRVAGAVLVGLGALALFVGVARNRSGDDGGSARTSPTVASSTTVVSSTTASTTTSSAPDIHSVSVFDLEPGMCVDNPELSSGLVTDLTTLPCEQPHSHEVYFTATYDPPTAEFDAAQVTNYANEQCSQAFAPYVGMSYDRSAYYFLHLAPSAESWDEQGDRDIVCLLFEQDAMLTGSAQGSAQ